MNKMLASVAGFLTVLSALLIAAPEKKSNPPEQQKQGFVQPTKPWVEPLDIGPQTPNITTPVPQYLPYPQIVAQIKEWHSQAQDFAEVETYGKSSKGEDLYYIRVTNKKSKFPKKKVMITGCIHGNEPHSTATIMAYIGTMLSTYNTDQQVKNILDTRDIYFVPVLSPDSYPHSRQVDGVDPNRNFPTPSTPGYRSVPPVAAIQKLFLEHQFKAVISGHTFGRVFLMPYGDTKQLCPNDADYRRIMGQVSGMCGYRLDRACNNYPYVIVGTEVDWYYRHGAFAVVMEFGTHQRPPTIFEIKEEFNRTYKGVLVFLQQAPEVNIVP